MMRHAYGLPVRNTLLTAAQPPFRARLPGRRASRGLQAFVGLKQQAGQPFEEVPLEYASWAEIAGTPLCGASAAFWVCVGTLAAASAYTFKRASGRHQTQHDGGKAHAHRACTDGALRSSVLYNPLHCKEWRLSSAATAISFLCSAPAAFRVGAPAWCRELSIQYVERERQKPPQPLKLQQIFEMMKPLVVQVYAVTKTQAPFGRRAPGPTEVDKDQHVLEQFHFLGSGFFFDDEGHIVTAAHVVLRPNDLEIGSAICPKSHEPPKRLLKGDFVSFPLAIKDSFGRLHTVHLCGVDETTDVAVLRVDDSFQRRDLPHVHGKFAVARPAMGETVATYAATEHANEPIGVAGQVLQPRQTFQPMDGSGNVGLLQLQLLTLPGMSGAPVFNMQGSIVGMLVKKFDVCGLALPSTVVLRVAESLRDSGEFTVLSIGLLVEEEMPRLAAAHPNLPTVSGLKVCGVTPGGAAAKAGVREGDHIISVKGELMDSIGRLREVVLLHTGGPMEITVQRGARAERVLLSFSA